MRVNGIEFPAEHADVVSEVVAEAIEAAGFTTEEALLGVVKSLILMAKEFPKGLRHDALVAIAEMIEEAA